MKATLIHRDGDSATVRITPSWLGRWFGARVVDVACVRRWHLLNHDFEWVAEATRRPVDRAILLALERVEVVDLPIARYVDSAKARAATVKLKADA
jgi:hypothetical protein